MCHESFSDNCGTFCAVGRFVPWDVLCHGTFRDGTLEIRTFCAVERLVPWDP